MTEELEELFARDPLSLTKDDIRKIVFHLRKLRVAAKPARTKARPRKARVMPTEIKL